MAHVYNKFARFAEASGKRVTCRGSPHGREVIWPRAQRLLRGDRCIIKAPSKQMGIRDCCLDLDPELIELLLGG